ncbi:hypothetical protein HanIR_Chr08g0357841 [Helianthus annuus]|nr:hypothetical protein HanIR_Chr08g0357841 [Helianthus annuus]
MPNPTSQTPAKENDLVGFNSPDFFRIHSILLMNFDFMLFSGLESKGESKKL